MQFVSADDHQLHPLVITPVHTFYYEIYILLNYPWWINTIHWIILSIQSLGDRSCAHILLGNVQHYGGRRVGNQLNAPILQ